MGEVTFATPGGKNGSGYLVTPGVAGGPGVLVLPAWWGLNGFMRGLCDRLAGDGFVALAADLYGGGQVATTIEGATALRGAHEPDGDAMHDRILGAMAHLRTQDAVQGAKVGVVGFSLGAWWALSLEEHVGATVIFYGLADPRQFTADAPLLGHFGEQDEWEPLEGVRGFEAAVKESGKSVQFHLYPGARHWFFESDRPEYDAVASETAYQRTVEFLRSFGGG